MILPGLEPGSAPYKEAALTFRRQNRGARCEIRTRDCSILSGEPHSAGSIGHGNSIAKNSPCCQPSALLPFLLSSFSCILEVLSTRSTLSSRLSHSFIAACCNSGAFVVNIFPQTSFSHFKLIDLLGFQFNQTRM
jgi:hypothetical protein